MKKTQINVLLDIRTLSNTNDEKNYIVKYIENILKELKGINLFYFPGDESEIDVSSVDAYISCEIAVPDFIAKSVEITKYAILNNVYLNAHGNVNAGWQEETSKVIQNSYDYFITFSEKIKSLFLNNAYGISSQRVIVLPIDKFEEDREGEQQRREIKVERKYCTVFYKHSYIKEIECAAKGFLRCLNKIPESKKLVYALACLEDNDSCNKISRLFEHNTENFIMVSAEELEKQKSIMQATSMFIDTFWLDDVNTTLLQELTYDCPIISNNHIIENESIIKINNSILEFEQAITSVLQSQSNKIASCWKKQSNSSAKEQLFNTLIEVENLKCEKPLVTIITITYNLVKAGRKEMIQQCIQSVHNQTYKNIEHIIIDGASNDGTLDVLKKYENEGWIQIFSEKDEGLYDAMNKGIAKAKGKYIAFLNSDDFYHDMSGVEKTVCALQKNQADYCFSDTNILNEDNSIYYWIADIGNLLYARNYCHQSMFVRVDVMKELGGFDLQYRVSSDSDLMIRIFEKGYSHTKVQHSFVTYRGGGLSAITAEESRCDHSYSFYVHLGSEYGLSNKDCYELWQYRFLDELTASQQARLIAKVPHFFNSEMILNEYVRRQLSQKEISIKKYIAKRLPFEKLHITRHMRVKNGRNEMVYYFCKVIPIWVTKERI